MRREEEGKEKTGEQKRKGRKRRNELCDRFECIEFLLAPEVKQHNADVHQSGWSPHKTSECYSIFLFAADSSCVECFVFANKHSSACFQAVIAQLVARRSHNPKVVSSILTDLRYIVSDHYMRTASNFCYGDSESRTIDQDI